MEEGARIFTRAAGSACASAFWPIILRITLEGQTRGPTAWSSRVIRISDRVRRAGIHPAAAMRASAGGGLVGTQRVAFTEQGGGLADQPGTHLGARAELLPAAVGGDVAAQVFEAVDAGAVQS